MDTLYLINALAIKLLGPDLLSLRWPLVILTVLQSCLVFLLFWRAPILTAAAAAMAFGTLTFIQFLNPQPHWYCLFLVVVVLVVLRTMAPGSLGRVAILGVLIGSIFLFRQLTGVFVAIAVTTCLLIERPRDQSAANPLLARIVIGSMFVGVLGFCLVVSNGVGFLLFSGWPLAILAWAFTRTSVPNSTTSTIVLVLLLGGMAAFVPVALYHVAHGTVDAWITTIFWRAINVQRLPYVDDARYTWFIALGLRGILELNTPAQVVNGIYWIVLPIIAALNGILVLQYLRRIDPTKGVDGMIPIMASFYGLVAIFNQISMYMYYTVALSFAGVLWLVGRESNPRSNLLATAVLTLCWVGVIFHAAQPTSRTLRDMVRGDRVELRENDRFERASLWLESTDIEIYGDLIELVHQNTGRNDPIFVFPNHPELYFLSDRINVFSFLNTSLVLFEERDVDRLIQQIEERNIPLIIYSAKDKHSNQYSDQVKKFVVGHYEKLTSIADYDIYLRAGTP